MQQCRNNAPAVEPYLAENGRDGKGMEDIGFAASARLALMGLSAEKIGIVNGFDFLRVEVLLDDREQIADQQPALGGFSGPLLVFS